jgi:hypothetical protein
MGDRSDSTAIRSGRNAVAYLSIMKPIESSWSVGGIRCDRHDT